MEVLPPSSCQKKNKKNLRFRLETGAGSSGAPCIDLFARSASLPADPPCVSPHHHPTPGMEQESGVATAGSFISLNEHEQRYYSGLHSLCQADTSGKLSSSKVAELFKASQLPPESLHKVSTAHLLRLLGHHMLPRGEGLRAAADQQTLTDLQGRNDQPVVSDITMQMFLTCELSSRWCVNVCVRGGGSERVFTRLLSFTPLSHRSPFSHWISCNCICSPVFYILLYLIDIFYSEAGCLVVRVKLSTQVCTYCPHYK